MTIISLELYRSLILAILLAEIGRHKKASAEALATLIIVIVNSAGVGTAIPAFVPVLCLWFR